ncbi:MAG: HD domain-containing protein [Deltaproteobacteria bacterium]|nr:HD domain-containing protein [Deltaproteobacteria bacterium]
MPFKTNPILEFQTKDHLAFFKEKKLDYPPSSYPTLKERKELYQQFFAKHYQDFRNLSARFLLNETGTEAIITAHTSWMDAWIEFTWEYILEEKELLKIEMLSYSSKQLNYLKNKLNDKIQKETEISNQLLLKKGHPLYLDSFEITYYKKSQQQIQEDIKRVKNEVAELEEIIPLVPKIRITQNKLFKIMTIFARGGYGREELSFCSDVDLGYCVKKIGTNPALVHFAQETIKRMEELFHTLSIDFASQYFELDEDFSRFSRQASLHAVPSILEGRNLLGNSQILKELKSQILPNKLKETLIRFLKGQLDEHTKTSNDDFWIKESFGGLRHFHYALWMSMILFKTHRSNSINLLELLVQKNWISSLELEKLKTALYFYFELRNFLGLISCYQEDFTNAGLKFPPKKTKNDINYLDNLSLRGYLRLKYRFTTVDEMDRLRLFSVDSVSVISQKISNLVLDRKITQYFDHFKTLIHLGKDQLTHIEIFPNTAGQTSHSPNPLKKSFWRTFLHEDLFTETFLNPDNLFSLFLYLAKTGYRLSPELIDSFSRIIPNLERKKKSFPKEKIKDFIYDLFIADKASSAVDQMIVISGNIEWNGSSTSLLGVFLPEVNQMRFLLRNLSIHEYPLCVHSVKALIQVEMEINKLQAKEPDFWQLISPDDLFALKWAVLFHDLGKINPHKDHEKSGPELSAKMLIKLGWDSESDLLVMVRLLVRNHQSVVRYSQLSTHLDLGILKFFELAERDPKKTILLYLINISDFKSVNSELNKKSAHLESFFEKTISILDEFIQTKDRKSLHFVAHDYLDRIIEDLKVSVLFELFIKQCRDKSLDEVIIQPLEKLSLPKSEKVVKQKPQLESNLEFINKSHLDNISVESYKMTFKRTLRQSVGFENLLEISPYKEVIRWFFSAVPNRHLLSSSVDTLATQVLQFKRFRSDEVRISFVKGDQGEYDTLMFYSLGDPQVETKVAYAINHKGINIENGKINRILYNDQQVGIIGYFQTSRVNEKEGLSNIELESMIANMSIPKLKLEKRKNDQDAFFQLQFFTESEKGYLVNEDGNNHYSRITKEFFVAKISLYDHPFCLFKILLAFSEIKAQPKQVTITTIGNQVIDYFYFDPADKPKLIKSSFKKLLREHLDSKLTAY